MVLKELICNSFYFGQVWWSCKIPNLLTVSNLGRYGGSDRTDF